MKRLLQAALFVALPITLGGCETSGSNNTLQVAIPQDCERLAIEVPLPEFADTDDAWTIAAEHRAGMIKANGRLGATRRCQVRVRERFAKGK